jgi:aminopeptidase N
VGHGETDQGPIYLGYRLGPHQGRLAVFRALVYNKGAAVLHMLRRFVGDEAFFSGVRAFYAEHRYRKAGTDDLQKAMEAASGRSLGRFFERWVLDVSLPRVRFTTSTAGEDADRRYEQIGDTFDVPVTATLQYTDGRTEEVVVIVTEASGEQRFPLSGSLRNVDFNRDDAALGSSIRDRPRR